jgi:hypothetical protein
VTLPHHSAHLLYVQFWPISPIPSNYYTCAGHLILYTLIHGQAKSHHHSLAMHPTRFRTLANLFPAATHSHSITLLEGTACHPHARLLSLSRVPVRTPQSKSTSTRESHETRSTGNVETTTTFSGVPPLRLSLPLCPFQALRMYAACPCPHATQLPEVAANSPQQRQVLSLLHQRAVL